MRLFNWIAPRWQQLRGLVDVYRGRLTHNDALATAGRRQALIGRVRAQYAYTVGEASATVDRWLESIADALEEERYGEPAQAVRTSLTGKRDRR